MARYDDLNTSAIAYATFVGSVFLLIVILLIRALCYYWVEGEIDSKLANSHYVEADAAIQAQKDMVNRNEKVTVQIAVEGGDEAAATGESATQDVELIHIPVDRAAELLLNELAKPESKPDA